MTTANPPQMMPLRVTRNDKIADGIHLFELRDAAGAAAAAIFRRRAYRHPHAERPAAQIFAVQRPVRARPLPGRDQARDQRARRLGQPDRRGEDRRRIDGGAAGQRFRPAAARDRFPVHRRRHRHHADDGDDPRGAGAGQTLPAVLLHALAGDDGVHAGAVGAGVRRLGRHPSRPGRSHLLARFEADPGRAAQPRASLLLRTAPADGGGAQDDRPLVADRGAFRSLQRSGDAQGRTTSRSACGWRAPARCSRCR